MSEMPELPEGMHWSAGINEHSVIVYLNMESSDPMGYAAPYSERVEFPHSWTERELESAIITGAKAIMAKVHGEIERRAIVERVSKRLDGLIMLRAGV